MTAARTRVVVVGNGMVGSRFAGDLAARDAAGRFEVTVLGDEEYEPYNRVLLSDVVAGRTDLGSLTLPRADADRVAVHAGAAAIALDRATRSVLTADGAHPYDVAVLATGSAARVPDLPGLRPGLPAGVHALRSLDDAREIVAAAVNARRAVVLGGGVLGLEVACGLAARGLRTSLVHRGATLMDRQLDPEAAAVVATAVAGTGVRTWTAARAREVTVRGGRVRGVVLEVGDHADDVRLDADLVVLAAGTVPQTALARAAGLPVGTGVRVGPDLASPADPRVFAIGDCAEPPEGATGLIAQGWDQARRLVAALTARPGPGGPTGAGSPEAAAAGNRPSVVLRLSRQAVSRPLGAPDPCASPAAGTDVVRVKADGVEVVTMGLSGVRRRPGARSVRLCDPDGGRHVEVVVADGLLVGATCVGAPDVGADLSGLYTRRIGVPADPAHLLLRPAAAAAARDAATPEHMPATATVCACNGVTKAEIVTAWRAGARTTAQVAAATRATTGCGGCTDTVCGLAEWLAAGSGDGAPGPEAGGSPASRGGCEEAVTPAQHPGHRVETARS